jgi:G3E family GTPase
MFLDEASHRQRLPVVLLSGFLGSGKTTLVNALLRDPRLAETAVAINEFGEVPLDQLLVEHDRDATVVMANGCLCCNLAGDMEDAVMRIFARRQNGQLPGFKRLIIEPSGLADPAPIAQAILRNPVLSRAFRLASIVTTVDVLFAEAQCARHPESRKQVALADTIVLTKSDLADPETVARVKTLVRALQPTAPIVQSEKGEVSASNLLPPCFFDGAAPDDGFTRDVSSETHHHASHAASVALIAEVPLRWRPFEEWLRRIRLSLGDRLLRVKGIVHVAEAAGPVIVQGVHHVLHAPVALASWPSDDHRTRLVLIVQDTDPTSIAESWRTWCASCDASEMPGGLGGAARPTQPSLSPLGVT